MKEVSIIIPAYNEEKNVYNTIKNLTKTAKELKIKYEIIVIDDGSTDNTYKEIKRTDAKAIKHPYNKGYGAALKTGTKNSRYDYVLFFDADAEHDPDNIKELIEYTPEYDMVVGARPNQKNFRRAGKIIIGSLASYIAGRKIPDINSGFRIIKKEIINEFIDILPNQFSLTTTITLAALKTGYTIKYVPINLRKRVGKSKIKPIRDGIKFMIYLLRMCMLFNPLKIFLPVSIVLFISGTFVLVWNVVFYQNISDTTVLLLLSGLQVFLFGLIADQMAVKKRVK